MPGLVFTFRLRLAENVGTSETPRLVRSKITTDKDLLCRVDIGQLVETSNIQYSMILLIIVCWLLDIYSPFLLRKIPIAYANPEPNTPVAIPNPVFGSVLVVVVPKTSGFPCQFPKTI
jgi:hypothetical protein